MSSEAEQHLAQGEKAARPSPGFLGMFKSRPDWDLAAHHYDQAAQKFRAQQNWAAMADASLKAADAYMNLDSLFMAAKHYQNAANVLAVNLGDPARARPLYRQAARYFQAHGSADKSAELLEKAARELEPRDVDGAIELQLEACQVYEEEGRPRFSVETLNRTVAMLLRHQHHTRALEILGRLAKTHRQLEQANSLYKDNLSLVLVALALGDQVAAEKLQRDATADSPQYARSDEGLLAVEILAAFNDCSADALAQAVKRHTITFLGNEVIRVAQQLRIPGAPRAAVVPSETLAAASGPSTAPLKAESQANLDEDDNLGIC